MKFGLVKMVLTSTISTDDLRGSGWSSEMGRSVSFDDISSV